MKLIQLLCASRCQCGERAGAERPPQQTNQDPVGGAQAEGEDVVGALLSHLPARI